MLASAQAIEPVCQFAVEGLLRNVASLIERVECVGDQACVARLSAARRLVKQLVS